MTFCFAPPPAAPRFPEKYGIGKRPADFAPEPDPAPEPGRGSAIFTPTALLSRYARAGVAIQIASLKAAADAGAATWLRPDHSAIGRPATHLHEITLDDVSATGTTEEEAAAHWYVVAARIAAARAPETIEAAE